MADLKDVVFNATSIFELLVMCFYHFYELSLNNFFENIIPGHIPVIAANIKKTAGI